MKKFIGFVIKEIYHIWRDKRSLFILFGMLLAQVLLFGFAIRNEITDARIAILDHSKDEATFEIKEKILSSGYFILEKELDNEVAIEEIFQEGKVKQVLIFESNFAQNLQKEGKANLQIINDASDPNTANLLNSYVQSVVRSYQKNLQMQDLPLQINAEIRMFYNPKLKSVYGFVPGIMAVILMLVSAMMTSISIAREKELGTMEILLVSPLNPVQIIIGKVMPYIVLSAINAVIILLLGKYVFGMPILGSLGLLTLETFLFIILTLSLGIFISTISASQQTAMMISLMGLMLPTILLSGFVFPIDNMPLVLQVISNIIPAKWFLIVLKNLMLKGTTWIYIWQETLVLLGMTLVFILMSIRRFKIRLE